VIMIMIMVVVVIMIISRATLHHPSLTQKNKLTKSCQ
jgi:TRAP-type C4-dicarboxylate transport system permease small subunit